MKRMEELAEDLAVAQANKRSDLAKRAYETFSHRAGPMMFLPWEQLPPLTVDAWIEVVELVKNEVNS